ncbi:MAG TPA: ThuA domain-containing protein [Polyangiaceae bacterium]|nr:ThuA domain-containing protein [Polyangiaceae bacterium]
MANKFWLLAGTGSLAIACGAQVDVGGPRDTGGAGGEASQASGGSASHVGGNSHQTSGGEAAVAGTAPGVGASSGNDQGGSGAVGGAETGGNTGGDSSGGRYSGPFKILVLSTTLEFKHDSIPICQLMVGVESQRAAVEADRGHALPPNLGATPDAMMPTGTKPGSQWTADVATDDLAQFTDDNLKNYAMIFSCNPTGTVFSANPRVKNAAAAMAALQKFVEDGGAWGGVHSATDFEKTNGFPWFTNTLVGGYFDHHDADGTQGTVQTQSMFTGHPVLKDVRTTWSTQDEWYYMNRDVATVPGTDVLARLASDNRPVVWTRELGASGRMFYTIRGHAKSVYEEQDFRTLVRNGILWATHRLN